MASLGQVLQGLGELTELAAQYYARWMEVPASDAVKARLGAALAELSTEAGCSFYGVGVDGDGLFHPCSAAGR